MKEERVSKFSIDSDVKTVNSSFINNTDKKQFIPSFINTTNSNASPTNRNINLYWNNNNLDNPLNASSYTNINTNDKTKSLDLLRNNEINEISINKKQQEKTIQSSTRKSIFILIESYIFSCLL